jgi:CheY-like chemotaxis protein
LMKIQLEALGHIVLIATDGTQGLEQARRERPDLVISDIKMPRTDGYSLIRQIRASPETASIPAIALTGLGMRGDAERARDAGFDACVVKPAETRELLAWIHRLAGSQAERHALLP